MIHHIETDISVIGLERFKQFLKSVNLHDVVIASYYNRDSKMKYQTDTLISYSYSDKEDMDALTFVIMKHGSIEDAFNQYMNELEFQYIS